MTDLGSEWVRLNVPLVIGTTPEGLAELCGWNLRAVGDQWWISLGEYGADLPRRVLDPVRIADVSDCGDPRKYAGLSDWPEQDVHMKYDREKIAEAVNNRLKSGDPTQFWAAFRLMASTAPDEQLEEQVRELYSYISEQMPRSSLWLVELDPVLSWRFAAVRILFGASEVPEVATRPPEDFNGFQAARGLQSQMMFGFEPFVAPCLLAASPWTLGFFAGRTAGLVGVLFGEPQFGLKGVEPPELLQLLMPSTHLAEPREGMKYSAAVSAGDSEYFFQWWIDRINRLLRVTLDPSNFRDGDDYAPHRHLGMLLSISMLFSLVQRILAHEGRDSSARMSALFDVLDLLDGLRQKSFRDLSRLSFVEREVDRMFRELPDPVLRVIGQRLRIACDALREVQQGFYVTERIKDGHITMLRDDGSTESLPLDTAAADVLRVIRNSTHSFTKMMAGSSRDVALLASHSAEFSADLPNLAFVHLIRLLENPEMLMNVARH